MTDTPDLTKPDAIGRAYDPAKFLPKLDRRNWWVVRNAGRKPKPIDLGRRGIAPPPGSTVLKEPDGTYFILPPKSASMSEPAPSIPPPAPDVTSPASSQPGTSQPPPHAQPFGASINFDDIARAAAAPASDEPSVTCEAVVIESATTETVIGIIQTAFILIGDDEGVLTKAEKEMLRRPLKRVLDKYDIGDKVLPAEIDLAFVVATLLIARLQKPKTATWFARAKAWFVRTFFRAKGEMLAREMRRKVGDMPPRHVATPGEATAAEEGSV